MIHITSLEEGLDLFKALGSDVRIQILNILLENDHMSMNQLATELKLSNGALTGHIKKLEECGLISTSNESASHGNSKICSVIQDKIVVEIEKPEDRQWLITKRYKTSIDENVMLLDIPLAIIRKYYDINRKGGKVFPMMSNQHSPPLSQHADGYSYSKRNYPPLF